MIKTNLLLGIEFPALGTAGAAVLNLGLPGRHTSHEHLLNVLERLSGSFGEQEKGMDCHCRTENAEYKVDFPLNTDKCGRNKIRERKVENPVTASS